jgi:quercetin dioxygenase-like cupin family protein
MPFLDVAAVRGFRAEKLAKHSLFETPQMFCDVYCLEPGQAQKLHAHAGATKLYYVLEGRAAFTCGSETRELGPGGLAWSPAGEEHGVENTSGQRAVLLVAMAPNPNTIRG